MKLGPACQSSEVGTDWRRDDAKKKSRDIPGLLTLGVRKSSSTRGICGVSILDIGTRGEGHEGAGSRGLGKKREVPFIEMGCPERGQV